MISGGKNSVGVAVSFTDQSVKVSADKLNIENSVPSNVVFGFVRSAQVRADEDPAITVRQIMNFFEGKVKKTANPGIVGHAEIPLFDRSQGNIEIHTDKYGFSFQIVGA